MERTIVRITKQDAEKRLGNVPQEYVFVLQDRRQLRNLVDLADALNAMSNEIYNFHVNDSKNDFSRWVVDIIQDEKLARDLGKARSRENAAKLVNQRIEFLKSKV